MPTWDDVIAALDKCDAVDGYTVGQGCIEISWLDVNGEPDDCEPETYTDPAAALEAIREADFWTHGPDDQEP